MKGISSIATRAFSTAVAWYWILNTLRLASGVLLLPLLLAYLSEPDLGMYYLLLSLNAVGALMDFGMLTAITRGVGFAMGGARELRTFGIPEAASPDAQPNYDLLWKLLGTTRWLYGIFAAGLVVILGIAGSYVVQQRIHETSSESLTWTAWGITLVATSFELYSSWWNIFLRGMNYVVASTRIVVIAYAIRLIISAVLLAAGAGLLSIPIASLIYGLLARRWSRRECFAVLSPHQGPLPSRTEIFGVLKILWPNSWRFGVHYFSGYLTTNANTLICMHYFGLTGNARYGLSMQFFMIAAGMAAAWTAVKWPLVQQLRARGDLPALRQTVWPRIWLQTATYVAISLIIVALAPALLKWFATGKSVLLMPWFAFLGVLVLLDMNFSFWSGLIATENRMPFLWPFVASNVAALTLTIVLVNTTDLGLNTFVLAPLVAGLCFNYWYWPIEGARSLGTGLLQFLFRRQR